jgi:hypothetical protein
MYTVMSEKRRSSFKVSQKKGSPTRMFHCGFLLTSPLFLFLAVGETRVRTLIMYSNVFFFVAVRHHWQAQGCDDQA